MLAQVVKFPKYRKSVQKAKDLGMEMTHGLMLLVMGEMILQPCFCGAMVMAYWRRQWIHEGTRDGDGMGEVRHKALVNHQILSCNFVSEWGLEPSTHHRKDGGHPCRIVFQCFSIISHAVQHRHIIRTYRWAHSKNMLCVSPLGNLRIHRNGWFILQKNFAV